MPFSTNLTSISSVLLTWPDNVFCIIFELEYERSHTRWWFASLIASERLLTAIKRTANHRPTAQTISYVKLTAVRARRRRTVPGHLAAGVWLLRTYAVMTTAIAAVPYGCAHASLSQLDRMAPIRTAKQIGLPQNIPWFFPSGLVLFANAHMSCASR